MHFHFISRFAAISVATMLAYPAWAAPGVGTDLAAPPMLLLLAMGATGLVLGRRKRD